MKNYWKFIIGLLIFVIVFSIIWFYIIPDNFSESMIVLGNYEMENPPPSGNYIFGPENGFHEDTWNFYGMVILLSVVVISMVLYCLNYLRCKRKKV